MLSAFVLSMLLCPGYTGQLSFPQRADSWEAASA